MLPDVLCIQEKGLKLRNYRDEKQLKAYKENFVSLVKKRKKVEKMLRLGFMFNDKMESYLKGEQSFDSLEKAADFFTEAGLYRTHLPFFTLQSKPSKNLVQLCEKIRSIPDNYVKFHEKIIFPLAVKRLRELGINNASKAAHFFTISEILSGKVRNQRLVQSKSKKFVYQNISGKERIYWVKDSMKLIEKIEGKITKELRGQPVSLGNAKGRARVVIGMNAKAKFEAGEILVCVTTNPVMLPLMHKSSAIIAEEGGVASHAAIVARELGKPCIIGVKNATTIIKSGNMLEVDADKGIIKVLK
jgi:phosphohistidine swiveling domain-containing protein